MLSRMKYINRWGLMNNTQYENISEHSQQVAILAHCLVTIRNKRFGGSLDAERAALLAVFHDATEIITGDMPTPVKYQNDAIRSVYKQVEDTAADRLLSLLPEDFRGEYDELLRPQSARDKELLPFVKAADRFSALIKCIEEMRMGCTPCIFPKPRCSLRSSCPHTIWHSMRCRAKPKITNHLKPTIFPAKKVSNFVTLLSYCSNKELFIRIMCYNE